MFRLKTEYLKMPYLTYRSFSKYMQSFNMYLSEPIQIEVGYVLFLSQMWVIVLMLLMSCMMPAMLRFFISQLCRNLVEENCWAVVGTIDPVLLVWHYFTNHSCCLTQRHAATTVSKMSVWLKGTAHLISSQVFNSIEYRIRNTGIGRVVSSPTCLFRTSAAPKLDKVIPRDLCSQVWVPPVTQIMGAHSSTWLFTLWRIFSLSLSQISLATACALLTLVLSLCISGDSLLCNIFFRRKRKKWV